MPTKTYAGTEVSVDEQGFFANPSQWREAMAPEIARQEGITESDRPALAGHQVHAPRIRRERQRTDRKSAGKDLRRAY